MSAIQRIARQSLLTFRNSDKTAFTSNMEVLRSMVSAMTASDVNVAVPSPEIQVETSKVLRTPVSHINIYECPHFTIGIFIVRKGMSMPLHDHPGMTGLLKVLYGSIKLQAYDNCPGAELPPGANLKRKPIRVRKYSPLIVGADCACQVLSGDEGCFHSIQAHGGEAAFLDILAPPYSDSRDCSYYREWTPVKTAETDNIENGHSSDEEDEMGWLVKVPQPVDFFCDSLPYTGPPISLEL